MKIKQSYHGTGSFDGYLYELYSKDKKINEIDNLPLKVNNGSILEISGVFYIVKRVLECEESSDKYETVWYELEPYEFKADFKLLLKE